MSERCGRSLFGLVPALVLRHGVLGQAPLDAANMEHVTARGRAGAVVVEGKAQRFVIRA